MRKQKEFYVELHLSDLRALISDPDDGLLVQIFQCCGDDHHHQKQVQVRDTESLWKQEISQSHGDRNNQKELQVRDLERFWKHELPQVQLPEALLRLASPLSPSATSFLLAQLQHGAAAPPSFCQSAKLFCSQTKSNPRVCIPPFFKYEYGKKSCHSEITRTLGSLMFFRQTRLLSHGAHFKLPNTSNDLGGRSFLPRDLADVLPFRLVDLPQLLHLFSIPSASSMHRNMEETLEYCASSPVRGELRQCHTTIESIVSSSILRNPGRSAHIFAPGPLPPRLHATLISVELLNSVGEKVTACHDVMFPYLVYSCHTSETSRVWSVSMESEVHGELIHGVAVCHMDTSSWDAHHVAFRVLQTVPGEGEVCHWLPENTFVWTMAK